MFRFARVFCLFLVSSAVVAAPPPYQLSPGDAIHVSVWREDALQKEVRVLPDGSVTLPLAGRIEVGGRAAPEVTTLIAAKLKDFLPDPNVTVVITSIEGNRVYVVGKVPKPGPVVMAGPLTVLQALSMAGGLDKFADESAIKVVRHKGESQEVLPIAYRDLISGRDMTTNLLLKAGDTIIAP
jgi:polysaccharide export outer membrane protein